jgi:hypothetical protein
MKNKKMLFILIPGTLIVWGLIIYKIVANMNPDDNVVVARQSTTISKNEELVDSFSINPSYRDPFLGKVQNQVVTSDEQIIHKIPKA